MGRVGEGLEFIVLVFSESKIGGKGGFYKLFCLHLLAVKISTLHGDGSPQLFTHPQVHQIQKPPIFVKKLLMQSIEIKKGIRVSTDELIHSVSHLDDSELKDFLERVQKALLERSQVSSFERENQLIKEIRQIIPDSVLRRFRQLRLKQQNGSIFNKELEEIQLLADILGEKSAERILLLGELATLRKVSLPELLKQIRLKDLYA